MTVPIGRMSLSFGFLGMFVSCTWSRSGFHEVPCLRGGINCTRERAVLVLSLKVLVKVVQSTPLEHLSPSGAVFIFGIPV